MSSRPRCLRTVKLVDNVIKHEDELPSLYLINPTSLAKNNAKHLLATDATSRDADLILVCETWFKVHHSKSFSDIDGYTYFRFDRSRHHGGSVCIYFKSNIKVTRINLTESLDGFGG